MLEEKVLWGVIVGSQQKSTSSLTFRLRSLETLWVSEIQISSISLKILHSVFLVLNFKSHPSNTLEEIRPPVAILITYKTRLKNQR